MNVVYRDLTLARVQAAIGAARAATGIGHSGLKGQLREIVIRDLFRPLFPADIGLGTGEIITADNQRSRQQDVVVFDKSIVPPVLLEGTTGVFPIESILYTIEIKTLLTAGELKSSFDSASQLASLRYLPGEYDVDRQPIESHMQAVIGNILAFESDLSGSDKTEIQRLDEIWGRSTDKPPIQMICVVGRGCWTWKTPEGTPEWYKWPISYPLEEVIMFISVMMNSYKQLALSRGAPRLGLYLLEF
jgi:Domain of unknown function (DUF6602)